MFGQSSSKVIGALKTKIETNEVNVGVFFRIVVHEVAVTGSDLNTKGGLALKDLLIPLTDIALRCFITQNKLLKFY